VDEYALKQQLLSWYRGLAGPVRDLPWRRTSDPYAIWVSETMLQQTRAATVIPYWERFLREFPTVASLAEAPEDRVLALWSGLGYYRRARMLHAAAKRVAEFHGGQLPATLAGLRTLPGVGAYTAGAIASIAFKARSPAVDGNVARVLSRLYAIEDDVTRAPGAVRVAAHAERLAAIEVGDPSDWTQAVMELGATVCLPRRPQCPRCPVGDRCESLARGLTSALPRVPPRREPRLVHSVAIVLASSRAVLLARRRQDVLFGGLWEAPQLSDPALLSARLRVDPRALSPAGEVEHRLSHKRMKVRVLRGALGRRTRFELPGPDYMAVAPVPLPELEGLPHAALTLKILDVANVPVPRLS
jgi:A/G-specific adenine glycosylase